MSERSSLPDDLEEKIILGIFDRGLLSFPKEGKRLRSDRVSPYYYDGRRALSISAELINNDKMSRARQVEARENLIEGYAFRLDEAAWISTTDHVFGKAQAASVLGGVAAIRAGLSYLWERVEVPGKNHGSTRPIEGDYLSGERICVTDDVVTEGLSLAEKAGTLLKRADLNPVAAVLQFDREDGGVSVLEKLYSVHAVTGLSAAIPILKDNQRIDNRVVEAIDEYIEGLESEDVAISYRRLESRTDKGEAE